MILRDNNQLSFRNLWDLWDLCPIKIKPSWTSPKNFPKIEARRTKWSCWPMRESWPPGTVAGENVGKWTGFLTVSDGHLEWDFQWDFLESNWRFNGISWNLMGLNWFFFPAWMGTNYALLAMDQQHFLSPVGTRLGGGPLGSIDPETVKWLI